MTTQAVAVVGAGRVGLTLARALSYHGSAVAVLGRHAEPLPDPLGVSTLNWNPALAAAQIVLVCVPDEAIAEVARRMAQGGAIGERHVVLHTAGPLDRTALSALDPTGAALGSFHPLQTLAESAGDPEALRGAPAILEGDARAVAAGRELAATLEMSPALEIPAACKPRYHAAAVFAANYTVVLADLAGRLALGCGLEPTAHLFDPLLARTLRNLQRGDPAAALTGPIRRGDVATVQAHLAALDPGTAELYKLLGREALKLAERGGLEESKVLELREVLG